MKLFANLLNERRIPDLFDLTIGISSLSTSTTFFAFFSSSSLFFCSNGMSVWCMQTPCVHILFDHCFVRSSAYRRYYRRYPALHPKFFHLGFCNCHANVRANAMSHDVVDSSMQLDSDIVLLFTSNLNFFIILNSTYISSVPNL